MGKKDIISKRILKRLVRDFATYLFGLPVADVVLLDTQSQRVEERRADLLAQATLPGGGPFLLHIEIQNDNQAQMPGRMLRYLSDIVLDHPGQPVRQYLVYIGKEPLAMAGSLEMPDFTYRYRVVDMRQLDCEDFLRQDAPDAWVLAILCDFKGRLPREVIHAILARLARQFGENPPRLREYVDMLDILASNRDFNIDIAEELKMLTIDVEKLATYRLGMEKGMEQGIEKGLQEGAQQGARQQALAIARNMLEDGFTPGQVAKLTGLTLEEVAQLRDPNPRLNG